MLVGHLQRESVITRYKNQEATYNVRKYCTTQEDHVSSPWRIFYSDLEFLENCQWDMPYVDAHTLL